MASGTSTTDRRRAGGFTLAEGLLASALLAVTVVAMLAPISAASQQARAAERGHIALALARQLIDAIAALPFADPTDGSTTRGPEPDETSRAAFDNVDDYHGYQDAVDAAGQPVAAATAPGGATYRRQVSVEYRTGPAGPAAGSGDWILVTVTVAPPAGNVVRLFRLCTNYERITGT